jgi:exonuclease III
VNFKKINNLHSLIIGGDLNSFPSPTLDKYSSKGNHNTKPNPVCDIIKNGYIDVVGALYSDSRIFTRRGNITDHTTGITHISASRIDHFLCSNTLILHILDISVEDNIKINSDHSMLVFSLISNSVFSIPFNKVHDT